MGKRSPEVFSVSPCKASSGKPLSVESHFLGEKRNVVRACFWQVPVPNDTSMGARNPFSHEGLLKILKHFIHI